ncbi:MULTISPECIES: GNAT family N-acetyltransferase [unclassified Janthinobacterium]|uniref:GNAT family N-acetyltransferase n=1 Tax=unclassified Janthinobacterium TaxID=2610881 RepID=UPI0017989567|nr:MULTISPECIES: GNAT family N-acetyltransferase [unclassified Janthinobacterium]MBB5607944.1 ribosomal protein S18 acetylase RimI-like enzyme [Janthinobacterium sp. S3T4]MBB5613315.1 ribosomal protein S18 acetylase RimI-like enzyme [Janthinobacterium sp. S3M3]
MKEIDIRPAVEADFEDMWQIFRVLAATGETYTFTAETTREQCHAYWFGPGVRSFVATMGDERLLGMYKLIANQVGHGDHVANASFMVDPAAQGVGVGRMLGLHCMDEARRAGYLAMQFNFVVSTNLGAVTLWKKLGFSVIGTLPLAYRHANLGYVDAYVMYQLLSDPMQWPA